MKATHRHINHHLNSRWFRRSGKRSHSQLYSCLPVPGCVTWPLNLALMAATKGERQVVSPGSLQLCSVALGSPFQKQQSFSMVPPCTLYATIVSRSIPREGFPLPIPTTAYLQRVLETVSEKKQYSLSKSLSKTHLSELKGNMSSGVNRNPA